MSAQRCCGCQSVSSEAWPGNLLRSRPLRPEPEEPEAGAGCERGQVTPVRVDTQTGEVMVHQVSSEANIWDTEAEIKDPR